MQKHALKSPLAECDAHVSDGYAVFVSLICSVGVCTCAILLALGIGMLG